MPANDLKLENQLCFALYAASLAMSRTYKPHLEAVGLTYPQYLVMLIVWERGKLSVGEICELLYLDTGTLTPLLKRLEIGKYILRTRDPSDERRVIVTLTTSGKKLKRRMLSLPQVMFDRSQCSRTEARQLTQVLKDLGSRLRTSE